MLHNFPANEWHDVYKKAPQAVQDAVDVAAKAAMDAALDYGGYKIPGDDRAEVIVAAITYGIYRGHMPSTCSVCNHTQGPNAGEDCENCGTILPRPDGVTDAATDEAIDENENKAATCNYCHEEIDPEDEDANPDDGICSNPRCVAEHQTDVDADRRIDEACGK